MAEALDKSALRRWRREPTRFIEQVLRDPETGQPFRLLPAERTFLLHAFQTDDNGRLLYPEQVYSCPKKSGKTGFAAMHLLTTTLIFGGNFAEAYCIANDLEQATSRVFQAVRRICEKSPLLRREARITQGRIEFGETGATIQAIGSDYAGAAGANPTISSFDELWGYTSERSYRLWDEMICPPTRKIACRLTTTYAGFEGESELLETLYKRGLAQPTVDPDLRGGDGLLMFWSHDPVAPWQTDAWVQQMRRSLRPNQFARMIENRFTTTEESFVDMAWWDACTTGRAVPADADMPVWVGVDASVKRDSTGITVCGWDRIAKQVRLVNHRIFQPSAASPINFESDVENTILDLHRRFNVRAVRYDPYQMAASAQRLIKAGVRMEEFPQSMPNLTAASQNLYELIKGGGISVYADDEIRLAVQRAIAVEGARGWKIAKEKTSHKIDIVVALAQAALAAVQNGEKGMMRTGAIDWSGNLHGGRIHWPDQPRPPLRLRTVHITEEQAREQGMKFK